MKKPIVIFSKMVAFGEKILQCFTILFFAKFSSKNVYICKLLCIGLKFMSSTKLDKSNMQSPFGPPFHMPASWLLHDKTRILEFFSFSRPYFCLKSKIFGKFGSQCRLLSLTSS